MSKTLLDGCNDVLKEVRIISSYNPLTSLTNQGKQLFIDNAISAWQRAVLTLYSKSNIMLPYQSAEDYITIVENKRNYSLPDDLIQIRFPLHDETNGMYIQEYPGGYENLRKNQTIPANYTGEPFYAALSPINKELYLDRVPDADSAGNKYKFFYWRNFSLTLATDLFPFDDPVYTSMVSVVAEIWRLMQQNKDPSAMTKVNYGTAIRMIQQKPGKSVYMRRYSRNDVVDGF